MMIGALWFIIITNFFPQQGDYTFKSYMSVSNISPPGETEEVPVDYSCIRTFLPEAQEVSFSPQFFLPLVDEPQEISWKETTGWKVIQPIETNFGQISGQYFLQRATLIQIFNKKDQLIDNTVNLNGTDYKITDIALEETAQIPGHLGLKITLGEGLFLYFMPHLDSEKGIIAFAYAESNRDKAEAYQKALQLAEDFRKEVIEKGNDVFLFNKSLEEAGTILDTQELEDLVKEYYFPGIEYLNPGQEMFLESVMQGIETQMAGETGEIVLRAEEVFEGYDEPTYSDSVELLWGDTGRVSLKFKDSQNLEGLNKINFKIKISIEGQETSLQEVLANLTQIQFVLTSGNKKSAYCNLAELLEGKSPDEKGFVSIEINKENFTRVEEGFDWDNVTTTGIILERSPEEIGETILILNINLKDFELTVSSGVGIDEEVFKDEYRLMSFLAPLVMDLFPEDPRDLPRDSEKFLSELRSFVNLVDSGKVKGEHSLSEVSRLIKWRKENIHHIEAMTQLTLYIDTDFWKDVLEYFEMKLNEEEISTPPGIDTRNADYKGSLLAVGDEMSDARSRAWERSIEEILKAEEIFADYQDTYTMEKVGMGEERKIDFEFFNVQWYDFLWFNEARLKMKLVSPEIENWEELINKFEKIEFQFQSGEKGLAQFDLLEILKEKKPSRDGFVSIEIGKSDFIVNAEFDWTKVTGVSLVFKRRQEEPDFLNLEIRLKDFEFDTGITLFR